MGFVKKIKSLEKFKALSEESIQALADCCSYVEISRNKILFKSSQQAEYIYIILYGSFKLQDGESKDNIVIYDFAGRGELIGMIHAVLQEPTYPFYAMSNEDSGVLGVALEDFNRLIQGYPDFADLLQGCIAKRFCEIVHDRKLSRLLISQKLADFLLRTLKRPSLAFGNRIAIPLTRVDLARKLATKDETVTRLLTSWTRSGWINTSQKYIEILDVAALEALLADIAPPDNLGGLSLPSGCKKLR